MILSRTKAILTILKSLPNISTLLKSSNNSLYHLIFFFNRSWHIGKFFNQVFDFKLSVIPNFSSLRKSNDGGEIHNDGPRKTDLFVLAKLKAAPARMVDNWWGSNGFTFTRLVPPDASKKRRGENTVSYCLCSCACLHHILSGPHFHFAHYFL